MKNKNHVITSHNVEQEGQKSIRSDVVIHNKLGNSETCLGLRHWRLLSNLKNSFSKPVRNDMNNKNKLDCFAFARNDAINKNIKTLVPQCLNALLIPLKKKAAFTLTEGATHVGLPPTKVKFAFTLAEVLITLGIIGVVAAITIPGLINNYKAQRLRSQFLESYSIVQQVFKQMESDDISLNPADYPTNSFYKVFMRYLQAPTNCTNQMFSKVCYGASGGSSANSPYKTFDGNSDVNPRIFDDGEILLQNGMLLLIENNAEGANSDRLWISVDLNGYKTPPNRWGYDLFTFQFVEGELKTMGQDGTDYTDMNVFCNEKSKSYYNGITCAQKAKTDTDYFKSVVKSVK